MLPKAAVRSNTVSFYCVSDHNFVVDVLVSVGNYIRVVGQEAQVHGNFGNVESVRPGEATHTFKPVLKSCCRALKHAGAVIELGFTEVIRAYEEAARSDEPGRTNDLNLVGED